MLEIFGGNTIGMNSEALRQRTKLFALMAIKLMRSLPRNMESAILAKQLVRSTTSLAANYRATRRARSRAEFISKLSIVVEEIDETVLWLELIKDSGIHSSNELNEQLAEAKELL